MAGVEGPDPVLMEYAETVITVCIMSIIITAPIGAIVITLAGPKLLSRTSKPPVLEGNSCEIHVENYEIKYHT